MMRECTDMERAFIYAMVICGGDANQAAIAAGYGAKSDTREQREAAARQAAHGLLTRERVLRAIAEETRKRLRAGAMIAAEKLIASLNDANLSAKDKQRAQLELLDRAGLVVEQKVEVTHKSEGEKHVVAEIEKLAKTLGLDPTKLLGHHRANEIPVDVEFTEIPAGLEDII
jgi:phage terminase small subunit